MTTLAELKKALENDYADSEKEDYDHEVWKAQFTEMFSEWSDSELQGLILNAMGLYYQRDPIHAVKIATFVGRQFTDHLAFLAGIPSLLPHE